MVYNEIYGVPVKIVRPFNVYGPGMRLDDYRVIPNFVSCMFKRNPLPVYGAGNQTRTFCYISDAITGFFKVLFSENNGEPFNVGNDDQEISILYLGQLIVDLFDYKAGLMHDVGINDAYSQGDPKRRYPDLTKIRNLGYNPKISLNAGLKRFVEWAKETQH